MKRIFLLIALVGMMAVGVSAQSCSLATLSHDGELTFFDKLSCFEDALEAAQPGDIIYLSSGTFGTDINKTIDIKKPIRIIGNGYDSHIVSNLRLYRESGDTLTWTYSSSAPFCDGVRLERLSFDAYSTQGFDQVEITASRIKELSNTTTYAKNLIVDRCLIEKYQSSSSTGKNTEFRNSKIKVLDARQNEMAVNCNIDSVYSKPGFIKSSIIRTINFGSPSCRFENCLVGNNDDATQSYTDLENCYDLTGTDTKVLDDNMEAVVDLQQNGYFGTDGTVVGIYGGDWLPYSESPTVPAVKASASSVKYDPEKNQLDVNITVAE